MKILVRLPNWLGDMVMATAFLNALAEQYPGAEIHVIVKAELAGLAPLLPAADVCHSFSKREFPGLAGAYRFGKKLSPLAFDLFFCLPDSFSSAVMGWSSGARRRIGYSSEGRSLLLNYRYKKPAGLHRTQEYLSLLAQFAGRMFGSPRVSLSIPRAEKQDSLVLLNFNSEASSRRMPVDKARSLISSLGAELQGLRFATIGSAKDKPYIDEILSGLPDTTQIDNLSGTTDLAGLTRLMASACLLLTTDSGPAHLANSLGVPVIVLFGAGNEANTAPFNKEHLEVIRAGMLSCEPCLKNKCPLYELPECMNLLPAGRIIASLKLYLHDA